MYFDNSVWYWQKLVSGQKSTHVQYTLSYTPVSNMHHARAERVRESSFGRYPRLWGDKAAPHASTRQPKAPKESSLRDYVSALFVQGGLRA